MVKKENWMYTGYIKIGRTNSSFSTEKKHRKKYLYVYLYRADEVECENKQKKKKETNWTEFCNH